MEENVGIGQHHPSTDDDQQICPGCGASRYAPPGRFAAVCESCLLTLALEGPQAGIQEISPDGGFASGAARSFGEYFVQDEIGRGGMGVIYRAVHHRTGQTVALKTVLPEYGGCTETRTRFRRESEAAYSLDHPNVMPIYEVGEVDGDTPFFCMKLAEHGSLHQLKGKYCGRWRQIAELMVKVAEAVHYAHEHGVLHRDLKPGNILFDEDHEPLVTDFGLAKRITSSDALTLSNSVLGTPSYIAPEQAAGRTKEITQATDVYGLGAVLYELLTGRPPFVGDNPLDVLRQVAEHSPLRPRRLLPSVPEALEAICLRCLNRAPRDRYASARSLAHDLTLWLQGRKITTPIGYSWFAEMRRAYQAAFKAGVIILAAVFALSVAWYVTPRATSLVPVRTVAVMFEDWGGDSSPSDLATKLSGSFKLGMAQTPGFRVLSDSAAVAPSPGTAFDPVGYGRSIKSQVVLSGYMRRSGQNVRLIARLVDCDSGKTIWRCARSIASAHLDGILPMVVKSMISDIEEKRRSNTGTVFPRPERIPAPEAQKLYTRAMELVARTNRHDLDTATTLMQHAVEIDPQFTLASGMLAFSLWTQTDVFGEMDKLPLAYKAARRTLELSPDSAQAHRVIAACLQRDARYQEALEEFWEALEIDPQSVGCCQSLALCLREMGQPRHSLRWLKRGVSLDPSRGACYLSLAESFAICGLDQEAEVALTRKTELDGAQPEMEIDFSVLRLWQKRFDDARRLCADARERIPDDLRGAAMAAWIELCAGNDAAASTDYELLRRENAYEKNWRFYGAINPSSALAYLAGKAGLSDRANVLREEAINIDQKLLSRYPHSARILHDLAATCSLAGKNEESLDYLEKAINAGWAEHRSTRIDPRFAAVASLPCFLELCDRGSKDAP